jgi:hypothetical protein
MWAMAGMVDPKLVRSLVKSVYVRLWALPRIHRTYKSLSVAETFQNIYRAKAWGDSVLEVGHAVRSPNNTVHS